MMHGTISVQQVLWTFAIRFYTTSSLHMRVWLYTPCLGTANLLHGKLLVLILLFQHQQFVMNFESLDPQRQPESD